MIVAVCGVTQVKTDLNNNHYQEKYYHPLTKEELKNDIKKDFGEMLNCEMNKLKINILI